MKKLILIFTLILIFLPHCSELTQILKSVGVQKPTAKIDNITLQNLNLEAADLLMNIEIANPNQVDIKLAGFDYELELADNSFLKGNEGSELDIPANSTGMLKFPLTLNYQDIYKTYQNLKDKDEINYTIHLGLDVNLPVLGAVRVPISKSDKLPTLKRPSVRLSNLKLNNFSLTNATFNLELRVDNPNQWTLNLNDMDYNLVVNNTKWAVGEISEKVAIKSNNTSIIQIPFALNYLDVGSSVFSMIKNNSDFEYKLTGNADVGSSIKFLENFSFPFEKSGRVNLVR